VRTGSSARSGRHHSALLEVVRRPQSLATWSPHCSTSGAGEIGLSVRPTVSTDSRHNGWPPNRHDCRRHRSALAGRSVIIRGHGAIPRTGAAAQARAQVIAFNDRYRRPEDWGPTDRAMPSRHYGWAVLTSANAVRPSRASGPRRIGASALAPSAWRWWAARPLPYWRSGDRPRSGAPTISVPRMIDSFESPGWAGDRVSSLARSRRARSYRHLRVRGVPWTSCLYRTVSGG
jgi:hypothetical protein